MKPGDKLCQSVDLESQTQASTNRTQDKKQAFKYTRALHRLLWNTTAGWLTQSKQVYHTKLMHQKALQLVEHICWHIAELDNASKIKELVKNPFMASAKNGTVELMLVCLHYFPQLLWTQYSEYPTILHLCITYRTKSILQLMLSKMTACLPSLASYQDELGNNILHLVARNAPRKDLIALSASAIMLQRELQWFKAVEEITKPTYRTCPNREEKSRSPREVFLDEHEGLFKDAEKCVKEMASSCSVVGTLISTVVFAAAFTVPGGYRNEDGDPVFLTRRLFTVFAISDGLALISSLTSVMVFLSVLTSPYALADFLRVIPQKLIVGLATLFFSIASMAIAFSSTYFMMYSHGSAKVAVTVASLTCLPAICFVVLQFPIFAEMVISTYGSDVLHRQSRKY